MRLTDFPERYIELPDRDVRINLAFDNVLRLYDLLDDKRIGNLEKMDILCEIFAADARMLEPQEKSAVVSGVLRLIQGEQAQSNGSSGSSDRLYDFEIDAERIYASFLYDYQIDLFKAQGKLDWFHFIALFTNFSRKSPMGQAFYYRSVKIPAATKYNKDEIKSLREQKEFYSLDKPRTEEERHKAAEQEMQNMLKGYQAAAAKRK